MQTYLPTHGHPPKLKALIRELAERPVVTLGCCQELELRWENISTINCVFHKSGLLLKGKNMNTIRNLTDGKKIQLLDPLAKCHGYFGLCANTARNPEHTSLQ